MKASVRESLNSAILFAAIGIAVAIAAPPLLTSLAATLGLAAGGLLGSATVVGVLGSALVFGGFGMVYPRLKSLLTSGKESPEMTRGIAAAKATDSRQIDVDRQAQPPEMQEAAHTAFRQRVNAERIARKAPEGMSI